ncbi:hypothetical protein ACH5RR_027217 [Cinchona calisaya]|uniref:BRI1 kinase inhibitor 1 n=1 Tax=Cinchona calisaya TaxID=153742 RepID=A0ABD2Z859_9GENT
MEIMDSQHQKKRDKNEEKQYHEENLRQGSQEIQQTKQQVQASSSTSTKTIASPPSPSSSPSHETIASPPSPSSSPSHEFSFTISLQPSLSTTSSTKTSSCSSTRKSTAANSIQDKTNTTSSTASFALDLSPADEIFFHGHLLPLHLLSHLPVSPRSSTNSLDSFTLPIKELHEQQNQNLDIIITNTTNRDNISNTTDHENHHKYEIPTRTTTKPSSKPSFSLFGLSSKWRKDHNFNTSNTNIDARREKEEEKDHDQSRQKRKLKLVDVSHVLKRYMRMVRPLLSFGSRRGGNVQFHRQSYSYSGNLSLRRKPEFRGRRGEFSAPASMRTSPTNSGLLVAGPLSGTCSTSSDSTMEELQAAIQAAIAHCKNSISMEDKIQIP